MPIFTAANSARIASSATPCKGGIIRTDQLKQHENRFPLLGAHRYLECADCHKSEAVGQFEGLSTACLSCHMADYQTATEPDHKIPQFPDHL